MITIELGGRHSPNDTLEISTDEHALVNVRVTAYDGTRVFLPMRPEQARAVAKAMLSVAKQAEDAWEARIDAVTGTKRPARRVRRAPR